MIDIPESLRIAIETDCRNAFTPEAMTAWHDLAQVYGTGDVVRAVFGINLGVDKDALFDRLNSHDGGQITPPPDWPILNPKALDGPAGVIANLAIDTSEADPAGVLLTALTWAGAIFGPDNYVAVGPMKQPPRLQPVLVGESSIGRKGTAEHFVRFIMRKIEDIQETGGPLLSGEGIVSRVRDPSEEEDEDGNPRDRGVDDKRLLVKEAEFGSALRVAKRQGNTLSGIIRMAWDTGDISPLIKHNRMSATNAHICIVGHVTPLELHQMLEQTEIWNGFANRILWTCVRRPKLMPFPEQVSEDQIAGVVEQIKNAVKLARGKRQIPLNHDAREAWTDMYRDITRARPGIYGVVTARAEARVLRIALIYALLDCSRQIEKRHLESAKAVWDYCDASARFIFASQMKDDSRKFLEALKVGDRSLEEMYRAFGNNKSKIEMNCMIQELQGRGEIEQYMKSRANGTKGRMKVMFRLRKT